MSGWIKFWKDMPSDPRVVAAAVKLSQRYVVALRSASGGALLSSGDTIAFWCNAVTGALATLWCYADEHIRDDNSLPITSQALDAIVRLEGFFEAIPREWIDELDDGSIVLPGYCEKNSLIAKRKRTVKSNARVTRWRLSQKSNGNGVTTGHVTQHTVAGDLDQDRDQDLRKEKRVPSEPVELERSTEPAKPPDSKASEQAESVARVFEHWRTVHRHPRAALDAKRRKLIRTALQHYSEADLCQAISGYLNSPHHMGQNDRATVYTDLELLLRDCGQIDSGLRFYAEPPRTDLSAKTRANVAAIAEWKPPELRNAGR